MTTKSVTRKRVRRDMAEKAILWHIRTEQKPVRTDPYPGTPASSRMPARIRLLVLIGLPMCIRVVGISVNGSLLANMSIFFGKI